uniref:Protein cereblon homolog n=1 Tax=Phallusia mammillata TaxID=59560 RepID=A0A6F9D9V0_9ASCI|nr:protein cereblon homolog [Phallusia mammillata]
MNFFCFISISAVVFLFKPTDGHSTDKQGGMLCRQCGETILTADQLKYYPSTLAIERWNKTILGQPYTNIQRFVNPQKSEFNLITAKSANIYALENAHSEATWFPSYAWRISVCPRCKQHLGWKFQPILFNHLLHSEDDTFVALIIDKLLEEKESDSLLLVPKSYKS